MHWPAALRQGRSLKDWPPEHQTLTAPEDARTAPQCAVSRSTHSTQCGMSGRRNRYSRDLGAAGPRLTQRTWGPPEGHLPRRGLGPGGSDVGRVLHGLRARTHLNSFEARMAAWVRRSRPSLLRMLVT